MKNVQYYAIKRRFKEARECITKDFMKVKKGECVRYYFVESAKKIMRIDDSMPNSEVKYWRKKSKARIVFKRSPKDDGEDYLSLHFNFHDAYFKIDKDNTLEFFLEFLEK